MQPDRDLDRELRDLGPRVEYPPTPDLAGSVRSRLDAEADRPAQPSRSRPQLWWIAAAALVLLVAVPVLSLAVRGMGGGGFSSGAGGAAGGGAMESVGQEAEEAAGSTHLTEEDESLAAGEEEKIQEEDEMQGSIADGGDAAGQTGRPNGPVPDVAGLKLAAACQKLSSREYVGYVIRTVEDPGVRPGRVVEQRPRAGYKGSVGGPVDLTVSEPYSEEELRRLSRGQNPACLDVTQ